MEILLRKFDKGMYYGGLSESWKVCWIFPAKELIKKYKKLYKNQFWLRNRVLSKWIILFKGTYCGCHCKGFIKIELPRLIILISKYDKKIIYFKYINYFLLQKWWRCEHNIRMFIRRMSIKKLCKKK